MSDDFDMDDLVVSAPSGDQLKNIEQLVNRAFELVRTIDEYEAALKALKADLQGLTHAAIPEAMAVAGTSSFKTTAGVKVDIKDYVSGSLPKDESAKTVALAWLEKHGGASLIKGQIVAEFPKGEDNARLRNEAAEALSNLHVDFSEQETVHHTTLAAFARERMKNGEPVALEVLGLSAGRMAKIERPSK